MVLSVLQLNQFNMKVINIKWSSEDVRVYAGDTMGIVLTDAQAETILESVLRHHDASIGINWDVIDAEVQSYQIERYPFEVGDDYWTIEDGKVTWSSWDYVSEQIFNRNPNQIYYASELLANEALSKIK